MDFIAPATGLKSFVCPYCGVFSRQSWYEADSFLNSGPHFQNGGYLIKTSRCDHCEKFCLWLNGELVFPHRGPVPIPNIDMPDDVKIDYEEAASIISFSPRGAAALFRLSIQKLCIHLGGKGSDLNTDIGNLVRAGLPSKIQEALDITRVVGNNAVHPGQLDLENPTLVYQLFALVNLITDFMISMPNKVTGLYAGLPENSRAAIEKRDK